MKKKWIRSSIGSLLKCVHTSSPTWPITIWHSPCGRDRGRWHIFGGGGGGGDGDPCGDGWSLRSGRFDWTSWGGKTNTGPWLVNRGLRTSGDAGIVGEESIGCHAEVRHKLDQQLVATGDDGSEQETKQRFWITEQRFTTSKSRLWSSAPYWGVWSPQYFPIRRESSLSPPLKKAT